MADQPVATEASSGAGWLDRLLARLNCVWELFQDFGRVFSYTRLPILILFAGYLLYLVGQGQDLIVIHAEEPWSLLFFYPAVVFWAVNAWYWARITLGYSAAIPIQENCKKPIFGGRAARVEWLVAHTPRFIGTAAFLSVALAQFIASRREGLAEAERDLLGNLVFLTLGLGAAFYLLVWFRRPLSRALGRAVSAARKGAPPPDWLMLSRTPPYVFIRRMSDLPSRLKRSFAIFGVALFVVFLIAILAPTWFGWFRADVVFLVGASLWIAPGTWLILYGRQGRLPLISILLVFAFIFSFTNDNHALRRSDGSLADLAKRDSPEAALRRWHEAAPVGLSGRPTLVMVATAGGGSRAAYWTASVLGTIQDLHPGFDNQLFGISGVSGGSLGAVVFRSLLTALPASEASCEADVPDRLVYRTCARRILGQDFLSSTLASMVFPDFVQRFLPWGFLPDRAAALEMAWEAAWAQAMGPNGDQGLLSRDFLAAWPQNPAGAGRVSLPALFLNGTSVATGKRIVTSNLDVSKHLTDAFDIFSHWQIPIPTSTAANNSARFPIIGPAGTMHRQATEQDPNELDRIVDGGYFENFGAATALDLLQRLDNTPCQDRTSRCDFDLVVIQISSDPGYHGVKRNEGDKLPAAERGPGSFAAELWSPVKTLLNTRTARGVLAAQTLHDWVASRTARQAHFVEFRLDIPEDKTNPPLGWVLSQDATRTMDCQVLRPSNRKNFEELGRLLGFDPKPFLDNPDADCD